MANWSRIILNWEGDSDPVEVLNRVHRLSSVSDVHVLHTVYSCPHGLLDEMANSCQTTVVLEGNRFVPQDLIDAINVEVWECPETVEMLSKDQEDDNFFVWRLEDGLVLSW